MTETYIYSQHLPIVYWSLFPLNRHYAKQPETKTPRKHRYDGTARECFTVALDGPWLAVVENRPQDVAVEFEISTAPLRLTPRLRDRVLRVMVTELGLNGT